MPPMHSDTEKGMARAFRGLNNHYGDISRLIVVSVACILYTSGCIKLTHIISHTNTHTHTFTH